MANSMHFNGIDLSGSSYGVTVLKHPKRLYAPPEVDVRTLGTRQGGYAQGGYAGPRRFSVPVVIEGSSNANLKTRMDNLRLLLDPRNGDQSIRFDYLSDRYWLGRLAGEPEYEYMGPTAIEAALEFVCADPSAWSTTLTEHALTIDASPDSLGTPGTGVVAGSDYAHPIWKIQNQSGGLVSSITLQNSTTGETINSTYPVPDGHYIRFDSQRERLEYSGNGSVWGTAMTSLSVTQKKFPRLKPGLQNLLVVTGLTAGTLTVSYRARYW